MLINPATYEASRPTYPARLEPLSFDEFQQGWEATEAAISDTVAPMCSDTASETDLTRLVRLHRILDTMRRGRPDLFVQMIGTDFYEQE